MVSGLSVEVEYNKFGSGSEYSADCCWLVVLFSNICLGEYSGAEWIFLKNMYICLYIFA